jgi:hypothetical protein
MRIEDHSGLVKRKNGTSLNIFNNTNYLEKQMSMTLNNKLPNNFYVQWEVGSNFFNADYTLYILNLESKTILKKFSIELECVGGDNLENLYSYGQYGINYFKDKWKTSHRILSRKLNKLKIHRVEGILFFGIGDCFTFISWKAIKNKINSEKVEKVFKIYAKFNFSKCIVQETCEIKNYSKSNRLTTTYIPLYEWSWSYSSKEDSPPKIEKINNDIEAMRKIHCDKNNIDLTVQEKYFIDGIELDNNFPFPAPIYLPNTPLNTGKSWATNNILKGS